MALPKTIQRMKRLQRTHLCLEVREESIYWARSKMTRVGMRPTEWGSIARNPSQSLDEQLVELAGQGLGHQESVEIVLRSARLAAERTSLPPISASEAKQVAVRRCAELATRVGDDAAASWSLRRSEDESYQLWLVAVPGIESEACNATWFDRGYALHRVQNRHIALGQLVHHLRANGSEVGEGELIAIFDLETETGTCVIADRNGWAFGREMPLRFMGRSVHEEAAERTPNRTAQELDRQWLDREGGSESPPDFGRSDEVGLEDDPNVGSGLDLASSAPEPYEDEEADPLADLAMQAELLATELRRTFRYVEGQLASGPVRHVYLTGEITEFIDLTSGLSEHLHIPVDVIHHASPKKNGGQLRPIGGAAAVLGMAHAPDAFQGNLLPAAVKALLAAARARTVLSRSVALAAGLLIAIGIGIAVQAGALQGQIAELEARWAAADAERAQFAATRRARGRARALASFGDELDRSAPSWTSLIETLAHTMPDEAAVHRLSASFDDSTWSLAITVEAAGDSMASAAQSVSDLAQQLGSGPLARIDEVQRENTTGPAKSVGGQRVRFRLEGALAPVEAAAPVAKPVARLAKDERDV